MGMDIRDDFKVHSLAAMKTKKGRAPQAPPPSEVVLTRVNPALWEPALKLAEGNARRILVVSPVRLVVMSTEKEALTAHREVWKSWPLG